MTIRPNDMMNEELIIRLGHASIDFARSAPNLDDMVHEPYRVNQGISVAANLREALASNAWKDAAGKALVMIDSPVTLVPVEEYNENAPETLYQHAYPREKGIVVGRSVVPSLDVVALFAVNKDIRTVIVDRFPEARFMPVMQPLWTYLLSTPHPDAGTSPHPAAANVLHVCFHDESMEVFTIKNNRFRFSNRFRVSRTNDAAYLTLNVWTQMGMNAGSDAVSIVGSQPDDGKFAATLRRYVRKVVVRNLAKEIGLPGQAGGMPLDMQALIAHGR